ncbi:MAG TPA: efflux RND transporter periplasmic adaptor subunit [Acetobacteraceae bacterium]|nr:efflux RND transporter periplasmic adaptor subunit [Acetobacteraceae bacterium]
MRRLLLILLGIAVLGGIGYAATHRGGTAAAKRGARATPTIPVLVANAQTQDVSIWLPGLGTVQAFNAVTVRSMIDGPLVRVKFHEGDEVATGAVLARIDPRPYQAALDQATAKRAQDAANLANAKLDLARYVKLAATNYTTRQQADTQRATVAELQAQVEQDTAAIETAQTNLSYTTITSPLAGRAGMRQVDQGNIIHTTDTNGLVLITQMHPISVVFTLPQQQLAAVRAAQAAGPVPVQALPQGMTATPIAQVQAGAQAGPGLAPPSAATATDPPPVVLDTGTLAVLDNMVDSTTGTIKLKATFANPGERLWPGGFVNVRLLARIDRGAVTVPPAAVQLGPAGDFVYVVGPDNVAHRRDVTVGHQDEQVAEIRSGLAAGDRVVTDGAARLSDGSKVTISKLPASKPSATASPATAVQMPPARVAGRHS